MIQGFLSCARRTLVLVLLVVAGPSLAQSPAARMDFLVQTYVDSRRFMGTVVVARGDEVILNKAYGSANLEWNVPNTPQTRFRIGSITKQFTAASILLLQERGKLNLKDSVTTYLPDAPAAWSKVTLFHLLTHTSGIPNLTSFPEYASQKTQAASVAQLIGTVRDKPLEFEPGERWKYSNSGYILLGALIEKISGTSYEKFLVENVLAPLGMQDSGYDSNIAIIPRRASGYRARASGIENAPFIHMSQPYAAGGLYSTTEDLLRWERGLFGNKLLRAESVQQMITPFKGEYGFGIISTVSNGHKVLLHGGGIDGFNGSLSYYPDQQITVAVLSNVMGTAADELTWRLGALAHGDAVPIISERKEIKLPPSVLKRYVGTYALAPDVNIMIRAENGQLTYQQTGQVRIPLFAETETSFFMKLVDAQVQFPAAARGEAPQLVRYQEGIERRAPRKSDTVAERREVTLRRKALTEFAGTYELQPGFNFVITVEDNRLAIVPTGQPKDILFASSASTFFSKRIDGEIEFVRDASGAITHFVSRQGDRQIKAVRR